MKRKIYYSSIIVQYFVYLMTIISPYKFNTEILFSRKMWDKKRDFAFFNGTMRDKKFEFVLFSTRICAKSIRLRFLGCKSF